MVVPEPTNEFAVEVDLVAEMAVLNPFDFFLEPEAEVFPFKYDQSLEHELAPFQLKGPPTPYFVKFLGDVRHDLLNGAVNGETKRSRTTDFLVALNQRLWRDIKYLIRLEPGVQTPEQTLQEASGSCRDSAWLLCQLLRHLGLAARFVSGYLIQLKPDVKSLDGPSGAARDFTDLHAWCEVYLPGAGWIGFDPTSGLLAGEGHIPLAATPDPQSAAPISGLVGESKCEFSFDMKVARIHESPRVTKPYTEEQWGEIESLGRRLDTDLARHDVRLTMGGEPTFVSIDDRDGAEWNTIALGPMKRRLADDLIKRLKRRFTNGALLHQGQGKLYPGESLPRWSFGCYWRKDGQAIWEDESLFADETKDYGFAATQAEEFIRALAKRLGCGDKWIMPAFEDVWYYLWKERRLPVNVDPLKSNLKDEEDRARLAKVFEQGLDKTVGFALPLQRGSAASTPGWVSSPWFLRGEHCYLIPGDSPMGLRLPLDSLPWVSAVDQPYVPERDPLDTRPPLPSRQAFVAASRQGAVVVGKSLTNRPSDLPAAADVHLPPRGESAAAIVRTALCVEPRHGRLHVFMPPTATLEDYLDCVAAVEETAAALETPVVIEGYPPPFDPRLNVLKVTPDPGVIEVNMHPAMMIRSAPCLLLSSPRLRRRSNAWPPTCRAAQWRTSSGWAVTRSAWNSFSGCAVRLWATSRSNPPMAGPRRSPNCWPALAWRLRRRPTVYRPNGCRRTFWRCFTRMAEAWARENFSNASTPPVSASATAFPPTPGAS